ncbi:hypothetical protein HA402_015888 [Bradysia odoriphaga]|nr:hypothetical protein HA402_015888 [Bradysia odoriphaga]
MTTTQFLKPKENDTESNSSSTHFTVVNKFGGSRLRQPTKPACCFNLITVIVSMTILFMVIIFGVIIFAEYKDCASDLLYPSDVQTFCFCFVQITDAEIE